MIRAAFAVPGDLAAPTGGYRYARELLARCPAHGVALRHVALPGAFPFPAAEDIRQAAAILTGLPAGEALLADGLAYGALPEQICAAIAGPIVALVHHPLALESGLDAAAAEALRRSEAAALSHAAAVVATSRFTADSLSRDYGVPAGRLAVAEPGTEPAARARGSGNAPKKIILAVGAVSPRKGYPLLMEALGRLKGHDWHLIVAGATDRDPEAFARAERAVGRNLLGGRVAFAGALSAETLSRLYDLADIFVMASFHEGYGMVLAEAMARGLPIVTTAAGAAAETVPEGAALKVPPGDAAALCAALGRVLGDEALRRRLADAAWEAGRRLPRWDDTARIVAGVLRRAAGAAP